MRKRTEHKQKKSNNLINDITFYFELTNIRSVHIEKDFTKGFTLNENEFYVEGSLCSKGFLSLYLHSMHHSQMRVKECHIPLYHLTSILKTSQQLLNSFVTMKMSVVNVGICGFGLFAINAATIDTRINAFINNVI